MQKFGYRCHSNGLCRHSDSRAIAGLGRGRGLTASAVTIPQTAIAALSQNAGN